ncbi:MAG: 1-acyl-sn-glycerol-3-phosphate acyltransferase, partial [Oscillospiraceae bacterium]|nr:1-acyl-sn-glycerol-3-phosphate acyltransferase [Oscillospiraceae bacterium]
GFDKYGNPGRAKAGAAMLAVRTGAWVVPVYIPVKKPWFRFTNILVGQPYKPETEGRRPGSGEYQAIADGVMNRVYALGGEHED